MLKRSRARIGTKALVPCLYTMARRRRKTDESHPQEQKRKTPVPNLVKWELISDFMTPTGGDSEQWDGLEVSQSVIWMLIDALRLDIHTSHVTHTLAVKPDESFLTAAKLVLTHGNHSQLLAMKPLMTWLITVSPSAHSALWILASYVKGRMHTQEYVAIPVVLIQKHLVNVIEVCRTVLVHSNDHTEKVIAQDTALPLAEGPVVLFMTLCLIAEQTDDDTTQQCYKHLSSLSRDAAALLNSYLRTAFEDYPGRGQQQIYFAMQPVVRLRRRIPGIIDDSLVDMLKGCLGYFLSLKGLTFDEDYWAKWTGESEEDVSAEPNIYIPPTTSVP